MEQLLHLFTKTTSMKNSILLLLLFASFCAFSQTPLPKDSLQTNDLAFFYILDRTWSPNSPQLFDTDNSPNYVQVFNTEAVICARSRNHRIFIEGEVNDLKEIKEIDQTITRFYVRGRNRSAGGIVNVEIIETIDDEVTIHIFQKLGSYDKFFSAHRASDEEISEIRDYWAEQQN